MSKPEGDEYWIRPGVACYSMHWPDIKMVADDIKRYTKELPPRELDKESGLKKVPQLFVRGVECHWLTPAGIYQKGLFQTTELKPWPATRSS